MSRDESTEPPQDSAPKLRLKGCMQSLLALIVLILLFLGAVWCRLWIIRHLNRS